MKKASGRLEKPKTDFKIKVSTIHDALAASRFKSARAPGENTTVRLDPEDKALALKILETNGATISDFLRYCVKALVSDYTGRKKITSDAG